MKASPLLISWHNENQPIYSAHFEPHSNKGRFATAGGDNNVRIWRMERDGEQRTVTYLSTLIKVGEKKVDSSIYYNADCPPSIHKQSMSSVSLHEVLLKILDCSVTTADKCQGKCWPVPVTMATPSYGCPPIHIAIHQLSGRMALRIRRHGGSNTCVGRHLVRRSTIWLGHRMVSSSSQEAWTTSRGSTMLRPVNAHSVAKWSNWLMGYSSGQMVRQIAEHNHYVQGVAWDPLNEYVATQSSDRSVHIYNLKTKDGQPTLNQHNKIIKMDLPARRISTTSPAPPEPSPRPHESVESASFAPASPAPSMPGTPASLALPMNPPLISHSRRSSFGSSPSMRRSASPAPSMPLPAVRPMENSPNPYLVGISGIKNSSIYANESYTSFFRRLTFAPDGSLLFTPAGQYKTSNPTVGGRNVDEVINTVYIYTRAGLNRPPIAHLPGHKKPSIAVKCSPIFYTLRHGHKPTTQITIDTASADDPIPALPDPVMPSRSGANPSPMDPPPPAIPIMPSPNELSRPTSSPKPTDGDTLAPTPAFALSYRVVYAVATQDAILVYDTQQQTPIVVVSNLHYTTFTDVTWYFPPTSILDSPTRHGC